ncbi:hypothetical protein L6R50_21070 [Myxococcota bacterium]|nr:hypothetical protein [Myxococcota bacterium]
MTLRPVRPAPRRVGSRTLRWSSTLTALSVLGFALGCEAVSSPGDPGSTPADDDTADDDAATLPDWRDPLAPGPFAVGMREVRTYEEERNVMLDLLVWYPAEAVGGEPAFVFGEAVQDAPPAAGDSAWPVVVFSHGYQGINFQSVFFTERLASHGYLVAAPNHPWNTFADYDAAHEVEVAAWRPRDVSATLDAAIALGEDPGDPFAGRVDGQRAAVSGHSYGGFTTAAVAGWILHQAPFGSEAVFESYGVTFPADLGDPRFLAGVAMTPCGPGLVGTEGLDAIDAPMLYFSGLMDDVCEPDTEVEPMWEGTPEPSWLASVDLAGHYGFSNMCEIVPGYVEDCEPPFRPPSEVQEIANALSVDFLGLYLRGDARYGGLLREGTPFDGLVVEGK